MKRRRTALIEAPFGPVAVSWEECSLAGVDLDPDAASSGDAEPPAAIRDQLAAYFRDPAAAFDLPLSLGGTDFQRRVWRVLRAIPAGTTVTYGELARRLGSGPRAVGAACRANPCPIVVPCHRVVARRGLGGFAGDSGGRKLGVKKWLLRHEGVCGV
jgi:methylated-DNA-[protein]-cysteine S-methyltransferase